MPERGTEGEHRGKGTVIDVVFIRHAHREPIDPQKIKAGQSPALTAQGIKGAEDFGRTIIRSPPFFGSYSAYHFMSSNVPRTQQTAKAIIRGAQFKRILTTRFPDPSNAGSSANRLLRTRSNGTQWNDEKIRRAAQILTDPHSTFAQEIATLSANAGLNNDILGLLSQIESIFNTDSSQLEVFLGQHFSPEITSELADRLVSSLYSAFIDQEEVGQYADRPLAYLRRLARKTLPNLANKSKFLIVGITHDFNLAGLLRATIAVPDNINNVRPIESFDEIGGAPPYLACLHYRLANTQNGILSTQVFYNGQEYGILPEVFSLQTI